MLEMVAVIVVMEDMVGIIMDITDMDMEGWVVMVATMDCREECVCAEDNMGIIIIITVVINTIICFSAAEKCRKTMYIFRLFSGTVFGHNIKVFLYCSINVFLINFENIFGYLRNNFTSRQKFCRSSFFKIRLSFQKRFGNYG